MALTNSLPIICIAGDSGDGTQILGQCLAYAINPTTNLLTHPDYPSEIRAPAGSTDGVSSVVVHPSQEVASFNNDKVDILVVFNAAALKRTLHKLRAGGLILADTQGFASKPLMKAGYDNTPLQDGSLDDYRLVAQDFSQLSKLVSQTFSKNSKKTLKGKNFFVLGTLFWILALKPKLLNTLLKAKFGHNEPIYKCNVSNLDAGYHFGETLELIRHQAAPPQPSLKTGWYKTVTGNQALSLGLMTAAQQFKVPLFLGAYPITPASEIAQYLSQFPQLNCQVFQAEDEIAAVGAALGASYGGAIGVTATSGPGMNLKAETINLAVVAELPLVVIDVQRAGPSTGMPTKMEQSDLLFALYGRSGDSPVIVLAADSPADCYQTAIEAVQLAVQFMTPVILLSDASLAVGSQSWLIPDIDADMGDTSSFPPPHWPVPGYPNPHRTGGLEKDLSTGNVSQDGDNHHAMSQWRKNKINGAALCLPKQMIRHPLSSNTLIVSWGSSKFIVEETLSLLLAQGVSLAHAHVRYLHPMPANFQQELQHYTQIIVIESNQGQFARYLRSEFALPVVSIAQTKGRQWQREELQHEILKLTSMEDAACPMTTD